MTGRTAAKRAAQQAGSARTVARDRGLIGDITATEWRETLAWFDYRCAYCNTPAALLELEHVVPVERGGHSVVANCVPSCRSCNRRKGTDDPLRDGFWDTFPGRERIEQFFRWRGGPITPGPWEPQHWEHYRCDGFKTGNVYAVTCEVCASRLEAAGMPIRSNRTIRPTETTTYAIVECPCGTRERYEAPVGEIEMILKSGWLRCRSCKRRAPVHR